MILADKAEWLVLAGEFWLHSSHYRLRDPNIRQRYIQESSSDSFFDANSIKQSLIAVRLNMRHYSTVEDTREMGSLWRL